MTTKIKFLIVAAVLVAATIIYFLIKNPSQTQPQGEIGAQTNQQATSPATGAPQQPALAPNPAVPSEVTVAYTAQGFSPASVSIPKGNTVKFTNRSSEPVWVASDPHPIHNGYPTTGGCVNSTFDSCKGIQPGDSWLFTFDIVGTWGYHNHLNPGEKGTVIVK